MRERVVSFLILSVLLAVLLVSAITVSLLSRGLPDVASEPSSFPASEFAFAFGSGRVIEGQVQVESFENGYALLSSGPVSIQAGDRHILSYAIQPSKWPREMAFFWRRTEDVQNVNRMEITIPGSRLIDLSLQPGWQGEISEFGFLVAEDPGEEIYIGDLVVASDSLSSRIQMTWQSWATFEEWSQKSINFLYGGDRHHNVSLPLFVIGCLLSAVLFFLVLSRLSPGTRPRNPMPLIGLLFLFAWIVVDVRWSINNVTQTRHSIGRFGSSEVQLSNEAALEAEVERYAKRLKDQVLGAEPARLVIIGDENSVDFYLLKAKYFLLPHSANVIRKIDPGLKPSALDFVVFIGEPGNIRNIRGWDESWRNALVEIDRGEWGVVFRVK